MQQGRSEVEAWSETLQMTYKGSDKVVSIFLKLFIFYNFYYHCLILLFFQLEATEFIKSQKAKSWAESEAMTPFVSSIDYFKYISHFLFIFIFYNAAIYRSDGQQDFRKK